MSDFYELKALEKENAELKAKCKERDEYACRLEAQLAAFHAAMEREKKPDWQKWLRDLADRLESLMDTSRHATYGDRDLGEAARQLRYMADSFTLKANFVPSELRIKELEKQLAQSTTAGADLLAKVERLSSLKIHGGDASSKTAYVELPDCCWPLKVTTTLGEALKGDKPK